MHDDGFAFHHTFQYLPAALGSVNTDGYTSFTIGMAWSYDRYRETLLSVFAHQQLLACNLVAGVLPVGVG